MNRVVEDASLTQTAQEIAHRVATLPPQAVRLTKQLIRHGKDNVAGRMTEELVLFRERLESAEAAEAFKASWRSASPTSRGSHSAAWE